MTPLMTSSCDELIMRVVRRTQNWCCRCHSNRRLFPSRPWRPTSQPPSWLVAVFGRICQPQTVKQCCSAIEPIRQWWWPRDHQWNYLEWVLVIDCVGKSSWGTHLKLGKSRLWKILSNRFHSLAAEWAMSYQSIAGECTDVRTGRLANVVDRSYRLCSHSYFQSLSLPLCRSISQVVAEESRLSSVLAIRLPCQLLWTDCDCAARRGNPEWDSSKYTETSTRHCCTTPTCPNPPNYRWCTPPKFQMTWISMATSRALRESLDRSIRWPAISGWKFDTWFFSHEIRQNPYVDLSGGETEANTKSAQQTTHHHHFPMLW